jgi:hypothetical protein
VPIAAIIQAFLATYSRQYDIIESDLTRVDTPNDPPDPPRPGVIKANVSRWTVQAVM